MQLQIKITGLEEARDRLRAFSDRRYRAVVSTAMTRTAREIGDKWSRDLTQAFDRPTRFTTSAVVVRTATAATLQAEVLIRDQRPAGGRAPVEWLSPEEQGGKRYIKKFEQALMSQGAMPRGYSAVPGPAAKLNEFGNPTRSQIVQVVAQLGAKLSPGYQRVISPSAAKRAAKAKASGLTYVAILPGNKGKRQPGVYVRRPKHELGLVFLYVRTVTYRARTSLIDDGKQLADAQFGPQVQRAVAESMARLQARVAP